MDNLVRFRNRILPGTIRIESVLSRDLKTEPDLLQQCLPVTILELNGVCLIPTYFDIENSVHQKDINFLVQLLKMIRPLQSFELSAKL